MRADDVHSFNISHKTPYHYIIRSDNTLKEPKICQEIFLVSSETLLVICCISISLKSTVPSILTDYKFPCRKWSKLCVSYDFEKNEAQAAFNGAVSPLVKDPNTSSRMRGR